MCFEQDYVTMQKRFRNAESMKSFHRLQAESVNLYISNLYETIQLFWKLIVFFIYDYYL